MTLEAGKCPSADAPIQNAKRQQLCTTLLCPACVAAGSGCTWCQTTDLFGNVLAEVCIANASASLCSNNYASPGTHESILSACRVPYTPNVLFVLIFQGTNLDPTDVQNGISTSFNAFELTLQHTTLPLPPDNVVIVSMTLTSDTNVKKGEVLETPALESRQTADNTRVVFYGVTPNNVVYPQTTLNQDLEDWLNQLKDGQPLVPGGPPVVGKGTIGGASNGGGDHLSGGELAGIIIGVIAGAALLTAFLLWLLLLRRKKGYPAPFRSPAASFRP